MKWIVTAGLIGWTGIVWLAWQQAQDRIAYCSFDQDCRLRASAVRDAVLTHGLTVALAWLIGAASLALWRSARSRRLNAARWSTSSAREHELP